jgi:HK97 family phage prohead protease
MKHQIHGVREKRDLPLQSCQLKFAGTKAALTFEGYASVWGRTDSYGDTVLKGAFAKTLKTRMPMMFFGHNPGRIPGKWMSAAEDDIGLRVKGELTPHHREAEDLGASMVHGAVSGLSIGGYTEDWEPKADGGRILKAFDLYEISVVSMPAEAEARIDGQSIKSALDACETLSELEDLLCEAAGFSKTTATAYVSRMKRVLRGEPGTPAAKDASSLIEAMKALTLPELNLR